jgi:hypothetical protein
MALARVGKTDFQLSELKLLITVYMGMLLCIERLSGRQGADKRFGGDLSAHLAKNGESCTSSNWKT